MTAVRVLLVNPPPFRKQEAYYDTPPYPRTGLAYLAGSLRAAGIDVRVLDCKFDRVDHDAAVRKIARSGADVVGFTGFTNEIIQSALLAAAVKRELPGATTVIGGVHAGVLPEGTLREFPGFDLAVVGAGEVTLVELVRAIGRRGALLDIPGVAGLNGQGNYRYGGDRERIDDLAGLAEPAWDLFRPAREYILHTQRGCPFKCPFCVNPNGRKVRAEPVVRVLRQIAGLAEKGCRSLLFGDEVFTLNRERTLAICRGLTESGLNRKIRWWCVTHVNCIDFELATAMREAGCYRVGLGLESGDEERLKAIGKNTSVGKILKVVSDLKRARLPFEGYFILGQPGETAETAQAVIDFAIRINPDYPVFGIMVPYPGTAVGRMALKGEGGYRLVARDWNDYNKQIGNALDFDGVDRRLLEKMQFQGYVGVFLRNRRLAGFLRFCWQYRSNGWTVLRRILAPGPGNRQGGAS